MGTVGNTFCQSVQAKSPKAIKISWVKGHATDEHVSKGVTTRQNKEDNFKADQIADIGVKMHGDALVKIAGFG